MAVVEQAPLDMNVEQALGVGQAMLEGQALLEMDVSGETLEQVKDGQGIGVCGILHMVDAKIRVFASATYFQQRW